MAFTKRRPGLVYPVQEDWIYVGSGGSAPAFLNSWANVTGAPKLAFRKRETGVLDVQGTVSGGTSIIVFTLPAGYRPSNVAGPTATGLMTGFGRVPVLAAVLTDGTVSVLANPDDSGDTYPDRVHFGTMQVYLDPPATA